MNWDIVAGKWKELKGEVQKQWGKLTDDDYHEIAGNREKLIGRVQERYGWAKNDAERAIDDYFRPQNQPRT